MSFMRSTPRCPRTHSPDKGSGTLSSPYCSEEDLTSQAEDTMDQSSQHMHLPTEHIHKIHVLRQALESDLLACDAKWTLFVAAALSYRYDCKLKPFPPKFIQEVTGPQIDAVINVINDTPKLKVVLQYIIDQYYEDLGLDVIDLLHWVLITNNQPILRLMEEEEMKPLLQTVQGKSPEQSPTFIFEVTAAQGFHSDKEFLERISDYPIKLAFCGQTLDSYYSILHHGFQTLNGDSIKLSTDLVTSLKQSPCGAAWGASQCGSLISCTALCEFACDTESDKFTANTRDKACVDIEVGDTSKLRARYLLFYGCRLPSEHRRPKHAGGIMGWVTRHRYCLSLASYLLVLVSIGVANSGSGHTIKLYVGHRIQDILEFCKKIMATE